MVRIEGAVMEIGLDLTLTFSSVDWCKEAFGLGDFDGVLEFRTTLAGNYRRNGPFWSEILLCR